MFGLVGRDRPLDDEGLRFDGAAQAIGAAFLALLLSCVDWAILAGETANGGRAATIEIFAGCGFALATVQLFYALFLLSDVKRPKSKDRSDTLPRFFRDVGGLFLCPIVFLLALLGVTDYEEVGPTHGNKSILVAGGGLWLVLIAVAFYVAHTSRKTPMPSTDNPRVRYWPNPSLVAVIISTVAVIATSAVDGLSDNCHAAGEVLIVGALLITFMALINYAVRFFYSVTAQACL